MLRSSLVTKIDGGLPYVFRQLLRSWFLDLKLATRGVMVELPDTTMVTFQETMCMGSHAPSTASIDLQATCASCRHGSFTYR